MLKDSALFKNQQVTPREKKKPVKETGSLSRQNVEPRKNKKLSHHEKAGFVARPKQTEGLTPEQMYRRNLLKNSTAAIVAGAALLVNAGMDSNASDDAELAKIKNSQSKTEGKMFQAREDMPGYVELIEGPGGEVIVTKQKPTHTSAEEVLEDNDALEGQSIPSVGEPQEDKAELEEEATGHSIEAEESHDEYMEREAEQTQEQLKAVREEIESHKIPIASSRSRVAGEKPRKEETREMPKTISEKYVEVFEKLHESEYWPKDLLTDELFIAQEVQESNYGHLDKSRVGAVGRMQNMSPSIKDDGRFIEKLVRRGIIEFDGPTKFNSSQIKEILKEIRTSPEGSRAFGKLYMLQLSDPRNGYGIGNDLAERGNFKEARKLILAAYNAGPNIIKKSRDKWEDETKTYTENIDKFQGFIDVIKATMTEQENHLLTHDDVGEIVLQMRSARRPLLSVIKKDGKTLADAQKRAAERGVADLSRKGF